MRFKVGDKVKLVRTDDEESYYKNYLGKIYTICNFEFEFGEKYALFEETGDISPYLKNLELVKKEYTYEDLKKSPIGTKVTFENGKVLVKDDEDRYENSETYRYNEDLEGIKDNSDYGKIIKIEEPKYETVYEAKTEILDEQVCIEIELENEYISLPFFKINTMYKGMQTNRRYTLKELGL